MLSYGAAFEFEQVTVKSIKSDLVKSLRSIETHFTNSSTSFPKPLMLVRTLKFPVIWRSIFLAVKSRGADQ